MSHVQFHGMSGGTLLLLAAALAPAAEAQYPPARPQTSAVQQLNLDSSATPRVSGIMRELRCRGKPGIDLRIHQDSSPRYPGYVTMVLRYEPVKPTRVLEQVGMGSIDRGMSLALLPGMCTWRWHEGTDIPPEPGVVYFDLYRDAQAGAAPGMRDTTIDAAENFPDPATLPRYLSDPDRYWLFFVDDVTNYSISFGKLGGARPPTSATPSGSLRDASPTRSGAHAMTADSAARHSTVAPAPAPAGGVAGPLRPGSSGTAATTPARALPTDSAARRSAAVRTPTPAGSAAGPLRDAAAGTSATTSSRAVGVATAVKIPSEAVARAPRLAQRIAISNVRTGPGPLGVWLTFNVRIPPRVAPEGDPPASDPAPSNSFDPFPNPRLQDLLPNISNPTDNIRVQFNRERPSWDERERRWFYPPDWGIWSGTVRVLPGGEYRAEPYSKLEAGQLYYYLITVFSGDPSTPNAYRTGSFTADLRTPLNGLFSK